MNLHEKALEAAHVVYERFGQSGDLKTARTSDERLQAVIAAYLSALLPEDAVGLVSELHDAAYRNAGPAGHESRVEHRAASLIQSQAARERALEDALEHVTELLVDTWHVIMSASDDPEKEVAVIAARRLLNKEGRG